MTQTTVDSFALLLLLLGYPVGRSMEIFAERLLMKPYPRDAWGSWLLVGWAVGLFITVVQFALGTFAYSDRLSTSFLSRGIPTLLYAGILLSLINKMFPEPPDDVQPAFLLARFRQNHRYYYACGLLLAIIPFFLGFTAFQDSLFSMPQISRIVWVACFTIGFLVPPNNPLQIFVHKAIWAVAFPFILLMFLVFSKQTSN